MSEAGFTKGPWEIVPDPDSVWYYVHIVDGEGGDVAAVYRRSEPAEGPANARLMAAAPDLLEALQTIVNGWDRSPQSAGAGLEATFYDGIEQAKAAIARATGSGE